MDYSSPAEKPLTHLRFYILLSLSRSQLHGYAIRGAIFNNSLDTVSISSGTLYPLLTKMYDEGLIEIVDYHNAKSSSQTRAVYGIASHGLIALKSDLKRLEHAVKVASSAGLLNPNEPPLDIQRLLAQIKA